MTLWSTRGNPKLQSCHFSLLIHSPLLLNLSTAGNETFHSGSATAVAAFVQIYLRALVKEITQVQGNCRSLKLLERSVTWREVLCVHPWNIEPWSTSIGLNLTCFFENRFRRRSTAVMLNWRHGLIISFNRCMSMWVCMCVEWRSLCLCMSGIDNRCKLLCFNTK